MREEHLSVREAMRRFGINDHKIIERWERIYLEEGAEGLAIERRGRRSTESQRNCQAKWKRIYLLRFSGCVRRMNT
ncbi:MAG: helix-turn-helix domain-containing protein [Acutalibacteraceae bacterium]